MVDGSDEISGVLRQINIKVPGALQQLWLAVGQVGAQHSLDDTVIVGFVELIQTGSEQREGGAGKDVLGTAHLQLIADVQHGLAGGDDVVGDEDVLALNAASLAGKLLQLANGAVYDEYRNVRVLHDRKLDALEDLIEAANGKPVLVMYNYQHDLTRIQQRFGKYGPENPTGVRELKTSADLEDWNAGKIPVAVTQPASTGHGLNLQHGGSTIVWFGLNWSLELYEQANARLWRQGQKETVVVHHLVVKGTMDEQVMRALHEKAADQNALLAAVKARIEEVK